MKRTCYIKSKIILSIHHNINNNEKKIEYEPRNIIVDSLPIFREFPARFPVPIRAHSKGRSCLKIWRLFALRLQILSRNK